MLTLLINESNPLDGLFANSTTGGVGTVPDITVADAGQAVSVQSFTRAGGIITDSFVAGDVLHIGIGDGVNAPVCYVALSSASPATGTMPINTAGMVALFAATVANQLSLTLAVVRTRGAYTNTIFSAPIVIRRSAINISTAVPTPSILGTGVAAALQVAINTALGFVRLDASARLPAVDGSQLTNLPGGGGGSGTVTSVAQSFTGGIISVAGSPITASGTLALTVAGTSGGIPYFSSGTTWATSAALSASALVVGGGAGAAPATITTGANVLTALGVAVGSAGAFITFNGDAGTPSAIVLTNASGTASGLTAGLVTSIGNLTGDVTSSNRATTLATVNSNVGSFTNASLTVNAKGLVTAASSGTAAVTSITGTANEITVTGTTTPTLSLPSALTFTGKTVTGGTFASPTLTTPAIGDGTESAPSLSFTSDTDTGVYRPAADTVGIVGGGNDVVRLTGIASATDYIEIKNGIGVGSPLHVLAEGASANIGVHLQPKGSGLFTISDGTDFNKGIRFRSSSSAASAVTLLDAVSTAGRVVTLPDATGTLALVSGNLGTPSALVGTNISGTASGLTAGNATLAATVTVANEATDTTCFPLFATAATGSLAALSNAGLTFNSATGLLSATGLAGAFNGTVGATTPSTVAGTTGTFDSTVTVGANSTAGTLNVKNDSGTTTASISGTDGSVVLLGSIGIANNGTTIGNDFDTLGNVRVGSNFVGGGYVILRNDGSARFANGYCTIGTNGAIASDNQISFGAGSGFLYADGYASFASGACTINGSGYAGAGSGLTSLNADNISSGTLAAARMANAGVHTGDATGTFPAITLNAAQTGITSVGTLTGGATGAGFTVALSTSTITGTLAADRGGTGVANPGTITLGGNLVTTGAFNTTFAQTATVTLTLPAVTGTLATLAGTETLTNKRLTQRTGTATSSATPTINTDNVDFYSLTAQAADITSFTTNLSGTPTEGQQLWIAITGTAARAITWGATFEAGAVALPTTTVTTTRLDVAFIWNPVTSKWRCMASG